MNPCVECMKVYGDFLCKNLGNCVFEGSGESPLVEVDSKALVDIDQFMLTLSR